MARQVPARVRSSFVAQGDKVVTLGHYLWRVKATDGEWESDFAHLFSVRDGRVTRFQEFTDADAFSGASGEGLTAENGPGP